ncbi:type III secretion system export apparatus subunit SctV [Trinickia acidisoli]|uniref:type III secretion system export apparatus subunit SctV n=1 Tax=Trinickia acidisoli TaxID=2767482 RepID=UPI001A905D1C|nr:type III secretion system export apparatus subunit SctV [Trinickia acidisoli]
MLKSLKVPAGGEIGIAALVVAIISLMILPLPPFLIDVLLALNISISVTLLMITLYVPSVLSLSAFPSLLLFTTLYRLSLNIASTKSILLHAEAGHIIDSFGELVVGGNLVVGLVVFAIITTVQFIVIAKGSERVAEVGARFTLDAMPGKQMSIDADLRANLLTGEQARLKRATLAVESQLHGGMDGAMKFVKGDAIAGLIITTINIVAGIAIGVAYHGMTVSDAASRFSVLSVGDAMVSQIPSLLLSVAAGVMITRVTDERRKGISLGDEIGRQLSSNTRALYCAAALLLAFAAVPGFPAALFILISGTLAFAAYRLGKKAPREHGNEGEPLKAMQRSGSKTDVPPILSRAPQFTCALGVRVAPDLAARLSMLSLDQSFDTERAQLQDELGLPFPGIVMWKHDALPAHTFEILVHDVPQLRVELPLGKVLLLPNAAAAIPSLLPDGAPNANAAAHEALLASSETRGPIDATGGATHWIDERQSPSKTAVWRTEQIVAHASVSIMRRHAPLFLGIQEVQWIFDQLAAEYPGLVTEVQKVLPSQRIADVLRRLLEENISIRNVRAIMESLMVWGPKEKDTLMLTEYVRGDLSRFIAHQATGGSGTLSAVLLDLQVEQHIRHSIKQTPTGNFLALSPEDTALLTERIEEYAGQKPRKDVALVTSMDIRRYVRRMIESRIGWLSVYSYQELAEHVELMPLGRVAL